MSVPAQRPGMARPFLKRDAFTRADRRHLARAIAATTLARVYRRLAAMLVVAEGQPLVAVAHQARVDRTTVWRWVDRYLVGHDPNALVNRHPKLPTKRHLKFPTQCHSADGDAAAGRSSPARRFSFRRYESPLMLIVVAWCSNRSRIALAITGSPNTSPHAPRL